MFHYNVWLAKIDSIIDAYTERSRGGGVSPKGDGVWEVEMHRTLIK